MMLAAWNDGVASCPNGIADADAANEALGLEEPPVNVLSFGYPARQPPARRDRPRSGARGRTAGRWTRPSSGI